MIHHYTSVAEAKCTGEHYAVGKNDTHVLIQLQDKSGEQVRVPLTPEQVDHLIALLNGAKQELRPSLAGLDPRLYSSS